MFRHFGNTRTFSHNLRLATTLSLVAGIVNVTGVLAFGILTTNVTGHFAFFSEELAKQDYAMALAFFLFTICFLIGAFASNFLTELALRKESKNPHFYPLILEIVCIITVGISEYTSISIIENNTIFSYILLFAMGIQNALVTHVSKSVVRTTHLTGLFTDLGIDFSQLYFKKEIKERYLLRKNIILRISIITFFFFGCLLGGLFYYYVHLKTLFLAALFLIIALYFDYLRHRFYIFKRKYLRKL